MTQGTFQFGPLGGGVTLLWRRMALGVTLLYWPCIKAPVVEVFIGPLKLWLYVTIK